MERMDVARKLGAQSAWDDEETGCVKVLLRGNAFNYNGISTLADGDGNRLTEMEFDYLGDSHCGLFRVHVPGRHYGFAGERGQMVIPPIYHRAWDFSEDRAWVERDGELRITDRAGREIRPELAPGGWTRNLRFSEGLSRVSIADAEGPHRLGPLAYYHDDGDDAGIWGYVDRHGKTVVPPQYIFAEDFRAGMAFVCRGQWTCDEKWQRGDGTTRWWSEEMLWGAIDHRGREVIPCKFQDIKWRPWDDAESMYWDGTGLIAKKYLAAQGGNGKWGIIDFLGNWVVEPQFGDIGYETETSPDGDKFVFYQWGIWDEPLDSPCGVYSIGQGRVLIPADKYFDIEFLSDTQIRVFEDAYGKLSKTMDIPGQET